MTSIIDRENLLAHMRHRRSQLEKQRIEIDAEIAVLDNYIGYIQRGAWDSKEGVPKHD